MLPPVEDKSEESYEIDKSQDKPDRIDNSFTSAKPVFANDETSNEIVDLGYDLAEYFKARGNSSNANNSNTKKSSNKNSSQKRNWRISAF